MTKAEIKKKIVEMLIQEYKKQDWKEVPEDIFIPVSRFIEEIGVSNYRITRAMEELVQERIINRNCKNQGGGKFYYLYDFLKENYVEMPENMDSDKNLNLNLLNIEELHNDYEVEVVKWSNGKGSGEKIYIKDKDGNVAGASCGKCNVIKPKSAFKEHKTTKYGLSSYCKDCMKEGESKRIALGQRIDILEEAVICVTEVVQEHEEKIGFFNNFMLNFKKIFKI